MTLIGEFLLANLLAYLISLAAGERSAAIAVAREAKVKSVLDEEDALRKALASTHSIRDEVRNVCTELARDRVLFDVPEHEAPLWQLLSDDLFQADLAEWLMAGAIEEGNAVTSRLLQRMEAALEDSHASQEQIAFLKTGYLEAVDKAVFAHPILAHWRHQLGLNYLREQVAVLRQRADESVGEFSTEKQKYALDRYCEKALAAWDIIDLSNLPEGDVQITTQQLLLRQLYMPLRIEVESTKRGEVADAALARLEQSREARRLREAGHLLDDEPESRNRRKSRVPVGARLGMTRRLVILGDPGAGKTTMLRWMATAYLLRYKGDVAFDLVPDTETLPKQPWIPVLIRCRDLGNDDLCRCFTDFLTQHLNKTELLPEEANIMRAVILDRIAKGEALLLVDGLDEITNPNVRMMFCQELERTAARYPNAPIVVTSRIVGYRDMPYRMGSGFEHGVIAELIREDKDLFARRWIEVTEQHQPGTEKTKRVQELIAALHSSDRIERLTGNPMLLTTLALVKRKVGKLPNRRTKLYAEAVSVLLNWNPRLYQTIEEDEAIPQLEYLAFEMCKRGVQRLGEDEVLDLLDNLRVEYPKVRAIRSRAPREFLMHLEQRSSILIRSGAIWRKNNAQEKSVWEFRHLTFQEYLAARALLDGRYPLRGKPESLAAEVAPLAGAVRESKQRHWDSDSGEDIDVPESWREALRLLLADCKDDDVDDVLLSILNPMDGENAETTVRPRAILAALCLADEPNVSEEVAQRVLSEFAAKVREGDGMGPVITSLDRVAVEVGGSMWSPLLKESFISEFCNRSPANRSTPGGLWGMVECDRWKKNDADPHACFTELVQRLRSGARIEELSATLAIVQAAFEGKAVIVEHLIESLLGQLMKGTPEGHTAAWALLWLNGGFNSSGRLVWSPSKAESGILLEALNSAPGDEGDMKRFLIHILERVSDERSRSAMISHLDDQNIDVQMAVIGALGRLGEKSAVAPLLAKLNDQENHVQVAVIDALGQLGDMQATAPLIAKVNDKDNGVRMAVIGALGLLGDKQAVAPLLAKLDDPDDDVRVAAIDALGQLGDKQAVAPLLAKSDDQDPAVRYAIVESLGRLGDKESVVPLLAMLDDENTAFRKAVIKALGQLGDQRAVPPLVAKLDDHDLSARTNVVAALHKLGEPIGMETLARLLSSDEDETRRSGVCAYAGHRDSSDRRLLSRDMDGVEPWVDPQDLITESRVAHISRQLAISPELVQSRYELMAVDLGLKLSWRS